MHRRFGQPYPVNQTEIEEALRELDFVIVDSTIQLRMTQETEGLFVGWCAHAWDRFGTLFATAGFVNPDDLETILRSLGFTDIVRH